MLGEESAQGSNVIPRQIAAEMRLDPGQEIEIARLVIAFREPRENAENLCVSLRRKDRIIAPEAIRIEAGSFRGEIYALYVRPVCQGMGLGKELFEAALVNLGRAGFSAVMLRILADNPTAKFFERMGGQPIGERMVELGGKTLREIAYGWGGKLPKPAKAETAGKPR